jgi:hypothetical protein
MNWYGIQGLRLLGLAKQIKVVDVFGVPKQEAGPSPMLAVPEPTVTGD